MLAANIGFRNHMENKTVNTDALAIGGILAGWEITPEWSPRSGDVITVSFESPKGRPVPPATAVRVGPMHIIAAVGMRAGGRRIKDTAKSAAAQVASMVAGEEGPEKGG